MTDEQLQAIRAKKWFKVLKDGKSFHGGDLTWSLPTQAEDGTWVPGQWHEVDGDVSCCEHGLHLTDTPAEWWAVGATCCEAEFEGELDQKNDKIAVRRCRLVRVLSADELVPHQIFHSGTHSVSAGKAWALGDSRVVASGSSRVEAWESSSVVASGSSRVVAWESSSVVASGSSRVEAWESSSVVASGSSRVVAWGSSTVITVVTWAKPVVVTNDTAVWVDKRTSPPTIHGVVQLAK